MQKTALITGITGQDGSYLAEFLLEKGYEVHGIHRRSSISNMGRIEHLLDKITLHDGDKMDNVAEVWAKANGYKTVYVYDMDHNFVWSYEF